MYDIKNYVVYGIENHTIPSFFVNVESIAKTIVNFEGHIKPLVHLNLFQVIFIKSGKGYFKANNMRYNVNRPCAIVIPENNSHEMSFEGYTKAKGKVITISSHLLESILKDLPNAHHNLTENVVFIEDINNYDIFNGLIKKIESMLPIDGARNQLAVHSYLGLLLLQLLDFESMITERQTRIKKQGYQYFRAFQKSLKDAYSISKTVAEYAEELRITPTHLNRICKTVVGMTASQVIQNFIIVEAKRNLNYTSHTISEVSYMLNFNDLGYFCRFFKKKTGKTPTEFRNTEVLS